MADLRNEALVSLDAGDWKVAEGEPDIRGWDVVTSDQRRIGEVDDLLADPAAMKVRYMTIELDRRIEGAARFDRTVRVPIASVRLQANTHRVVLETAGTELESLARAAPQAGAGISAGVGGSAPRAAARSTRG